MQEAQNLFIETPELLAEKRKQEIAAMLLKQLSGGAPQVEKTRILAKQPILGTLLNAGGQFLARNDLQRADQRVGEITQSQRQKAQDEYSTASNEMMNAPDKNAAIAKFIASGNPMVRALAQAELKAMREAQEKEYERRRALREKGAAVLDNSGDTTGALRILAPGGEVDPTRQPPVREQPSVGLAPVDPNNPTAPRPTVTRNIDKYGRPTLSVTAAPDETRIVMGKEEEALDKAIGGEIPKILEKAATEITRSSEAQMAADRILRLAQDPQVIAGFAAEPRNFFANASAFFGFSGPDAPAKTQTLLSHIAEQTLDASADLKGATTEREWPRLEQARAGQLSYTPQALQELAHIARAKAHNKMILAVRQRNATAARSEKAAGVAELYPIPPIHELDFPESLYERGPGGTVRYKGSIDALLGKTRQSTTKPQKQSPAEIQAEIERLERELGMRK